MGLPHRYHPDPDKDRIPDAKLFDGCERCHEQADNLAGLDNQKLHWFWSAMHQINREGKNPDRPLTNNELLAIGRLYHLAIIIERLTRVWPSPEALLRFSIAERGE